MIWLFEVKDFRVAGRGKIEELVHEIGRKVRDATALLFCAQVSDHSTGPTSAGAFARESRSAQRLRVVLHCEFASSTSGLLPDVSRRANTLHKLREHVAAIDRKPILVCVGASAVTPWTVDDLRT